VLAQQAEHFPRAVLIREPVEAMTRSGALQHVYDNRPGSGMRLQMLVLAERLSTYWQASIAIAGQAPSAASLVLADGHVDLDGQIFIAEHVRAGRMSTCEASEYWAFVRNESRRLMPSTLGKPTLYIYLRAPGQVCARRAAARNRQEEMGLDVAWFDRVAAASEHVAVGLRAAGANVVTVNAGTSEDCVRCTVSEAIAHAYKTLCETTTV